MCINQLYKPYVHVFNHNQQNNMLRYLVVEENILKTIIPSFTKYFCKYLIFSERNRNLKGVFTKWVLFHSNLAVEDHFVQNIKL